jgi:hypothetical protein
MHLARFKLELGIAKQSRPLRKDLSHRTLEIVLAERISLTTRNLR